MNGYKKGSQVNDFTLFDNNAVSVRDDFIRIQALLGQCSLNVNPAKTHVDGSMGQVKDAVSSIRKSLKKFTTEFEYVEGASGVEVHEVLVEKEKKLSADQVESLLGLLKHEGLEESDADYILGFLKSHTDEILEYLPTLIRRFPNLIKHIHSVCSGIPDKSGLAEAVLEVVEKNDSLLEYQLFWLAAIVEDHLIGHGPYGKALMLIYERTAEMRIARAKVLEVPEQGFGLKEARAEYMKTGQSDWLSWASAMGTRVLPLAERNYQLKYFSKASPMNALVGACVKAL